MSVRIPNLVLSLATIVIFLEPVSARMYERPASFDVKVRPLYRVNREIMPSVDIKALVREDEPHAAAQKHPRPQRFAATIDRNLNLNNFTLDKVADGKIWRLRIHSTGAQSLHIAFTEFEVAEGVKVWIYNPTRDYVEGPYTLRHRTSQGQLWTPLVPGEEIVVEVFVPAGGQSDPSLTIGKVYHGYRTFHEPEDIGAEEDRIDCNTDVICPKGDDWRDEIRSVARYVIGGSWCSGQLINNTSGNFQPYFLSALHCVKNDGDSDATVKARVEGLVIYWNFESPTCGDRSGGNTQDNQTGATFLAGSPVSDFLLVVLKQSPDAEFNVYYTGWDASQAAPTAGVAIHHAGGREKAISFDSQAPTTTAYLADSPDPTEPQTQSHWRLADWDDGSTEGGSSGSCLWNRETGHCVGQLHGGWANCDLRVPVWYGKLSVSWAGDGTENTRLRDWLNPANDGTKALDGVDPLRPTPCEPTTLCVDGGSCSANECSR